MNYTTNASTTNDIYKSLNEEEKLELQLIKSIIGNTNSKEKVLPYLKDSYFQNSGNQELFKFIKRNPEHSFEELELQIPLVSSNDRKEKLKETIEIVKTCPVVNEDIFNDIATEFIKKAMLNDFLYTTSDKVSNDILPTISEIAKSIDEFSLNKKKITKSLTEIMAMQIEDYNWHCENFIPIIGDNLTMITGRGASGKGISMLRNAIQYLTENENKKALLWNMEDTCDDIHRRINILKYNGVSVPNHIYGRLSVLDNYENFNLEEMRVHFKDFDYVVIDPLSYLIDGEENNAAAVKPVIQRFQQICSEEKKIIILVHHEAKGSNGTGSGHARGSSSFFDNVRLSYSVSHTDDDEYIVKNTKNNYAKKRDPFPIDPWNENTKAFSSNIPESPELKALFESLDNDGWE